MATGCRNQCLTFHFNIFITLIHHTVTMFVCITTPLTLPAQGIMSLSEEELLAFCGVRTPLEPSPEQQQAADLTPAYDASQAHAYVLTRLPGCHAVARKVLGEIKGRLAGYKPKLMLDFGSGPGTAIWAAQEVGCFFTVICTCHVHVNVDRQQ